MDQRAFPFISFGNIPDMKRIKLKVQAAAATTLMIGGEWAD